MELAAQREIVVWAHIALDFPGKGSIAVHVDGLLLVAAPPGPERRACGGVSIATGAVRMQRTKTMASKQTRKQATSPAKADTGEANKPARNRQRIPRRRASQARSGSAATQTSSATTQAAVAASEGIDLSKNTTPSPGPQPSQSKPQSEGADLATSSVAGTDRPRASTKRAALIGMLERPEGASVAEIGQRLGWLPHTVRAAITGLRHAGREVTRSKDATGQSVYRLARVETAPDR